MGDGKHCGYCYTMLCEEEVVLIVALTRALNGQVLPGTQYLHFFILKGRVPAVLRGATRGNRYSK